MKLDRRDFFKSAAGVTALTLGLNVFSPPIFKRKLLAAPPPPGTKKLLFIFQRGGNDAINTVIPRGDTMYNATLRPTLYLKPEDAISLDGTNPLYPIDSTLQNSFVQLHPSLAPLMELYQSGDLAILHRVGYKNQSQSHFDSQQFYENGTTNPAVDVGMIYRQANESLDLIHNHFAAVGISSSQMLALKGPNPVPNIPDLTSFKFNGTDARTLKFLGRLPAPGVTGRGILGAYGGARDYAQKPYRDMVYQSGLVLADAMNTVKANGINPSTYVPQNGATYPASSGFYYKAKECAQLFKETPVQILGMNIGGWDTHTNQGALTGGQPGLLYQVALTLQSLYRDLRDQWQDLIIVTMSEFGRTSYENGSKGTDHGSAIVMFVAGGGVKGGVYNAASSSSWMADGGILSTSNGRYLRYHTDFRAVFAEIFMKHFGDDLAAINRVIPNYNTLASGDAAGFTQLGIL
jgi:uncharacterized protein (DUF1501 family)